MSYTRNFGFRDLSNIVRDGRNAVPTGLSGNDANGYLIGSAVTVDPSAAGKLTRPAAGAAPTALSGIVLYEHLQFQGVDPLLTTFLDPPFIYAPQGRYAQMVHGLGVKVWFKNTSNTPLYDGRTQVGGTLVSSPLSALKIGDGLVPDTNGVWTTTTSQESQTVTEGGSGLTSFTLTLSGQTTGSILAAATAAQVKTALEALSNVGAGNVLVTGSASGPYTVVFTGSLAETNVAQMTATPTGGSGTVTVATVTGGGTASLSSAWLVVESVNPTTGLVEARFTF